MEKTMLYINKLIHTKLSSGKNMLELTTYENVSVWWCIDNAFYNTLHSVMHGKRSKVILLPVYFIEFYARCGIYFECACDLILAAFLRLIECVYRKKSYDIRPGSRTIVFTAQDLTWKTTQDYETRQMRRTDAFFDSTLKSLGDCNSISIYPITNHPIRGLNTYLKKLVGWDITHIPLNRFWSFNAYREQKLAMKYFRKQFKCILNDKTFRELCIENGIDLNDNIIRLLEFYFTILLPYQIKLITMTRDMIRYIHPDVMVLLNEYSWDFRPMLIGAKLERIPVVAIQHGIIIPSHRGYIYENGDISANGTVSSPYCPIPDKTAVYGQYYYDLLTNFSAYPKNTVEITGQPRYDIIYHANELYSKDEFLRRTKVSDGDKIVLWTTQCHDLSHDENIKNFDAVFAAIKDLEDTTLIIKQHPGEKEIHTQLIRDYLKKHNLHAVITPKDSDTIEQIVACDIMITKHSTTAIEAVALNKPVIVLNLSGVEDVTEWVKEGIAKGVYDCRDLKMIIQNLLNDDSILVKNRQEFVAKHFYKIDGRSSERVADLIKDVISRKS